MRLTDTEQRVESGGEAGFLFDFADSSLINVFSRVKETGWNLPHACSSKRTLLLLDSENEGEAWVDDDTANTDLVGGSNREAGDGVIVVLVSAGGAGEIKELLWRKSLGRSVGLMRVELALRGAGRLRIGERIRIAWEPEAESGTLSFRIVEAKAELGSDRDKMGLLDVETQPYSLSSLSLPLEQAVGELNMEGVGIK